MKPAPVNAMAANVTATPIASTPVLHAQTQTFQ
jgi:hypothetical protein